jgi:hypothetical protein
MDRHLELNMDTQTEAKGIEIGTETLKDLNIARKWAMFLAIIGFIVLGLFIILGLIAGTFLKTFGGGESISGIPESLIFISYIILALVYFFPVMYLFRFSKFTSRAILSLDRKYLDKAIKNLKLYFAYIGILIIIILSFYIVVLIVAGSSIAFLKGL